MPTRAPWRGTAARGRSVGPSRPATGAPSRAAACAAPRAHPCRRRWRQLIAISAGLAVRSLAVYWPRRLRMRAETRGPEWRRACRRSSCALYRACHSASFGRQRIVLGTRALAAARGARGASHRERRRSSAAPSCRSARVRPSMKRDDRVDARPSAPRDSPAWTRSSSPRKLTITLRFRVSRQRPIRLSPSARSRASSSSAVARLRASSSSCELRRDRGVAGTRADSAREALDRARQRTPRWSSDQTSVDTSISVAR